MLLRLRVLACLAAFALTTAAQTIEDGIMMGKHRLFAGGTYSHDSWDRYWQGELSRVNGNIGTLTTGVNNWSGNFGVTDRFNVIAMLPFIWTDPSQGIMRGSSGFQDLTVAAKYAFVERPLTRKGVFRAIAVGSFAVPVSDYDFDFLPMSIGTHSKRVAGRLTLNFQSHQGWFVNGSGAYTWRSNVRLDRPYYYTDGKLHFTDIVDMPNVFDYVGSVGYRKPRLLTQFTFAQQRTLGGGDIRRQDAPFVSNRMNFTRIGGMVMVPVPLIPNLAVLFAYHYVPQGRNVGQSTIYSTGLMYTFRFPGSSTDESIN